MTTSTANYRIWIISEGSPGHVSQSIGLTTALAELVQLNVRQFECRPRIGGFARTLIRLFWMGRRGRRLPDWILDRWLRLELAGKHDLAPDLIVASGGKSVFAARSLAVKHQAPFIFLGERKPYPATWFHTVFTPSSLETAACDIRMDVIPTKISAEVVHQAAAEWNEKPAGRLWTMLIGGSSRSHHYQSAEWAQLAAGMVDIARREGIRWLVTTSRRTGKEVEETLRGLLPADVVADAVWWCHLPEKKFAAYLGAAETIWATQDSVSMVTEATATGKPVVAVYPEHTPFPATSFMPGYLENLERLGLIQRLPIAAIADFHKLERSNSVSTPLNTASLAGIALKRLGWS